MVVGQQLETVIDLIKARRARVPANIQESRALGDEFWGAYALAEDVEYEPVDSGGVPAEWISTPGAADDRIVLYLHGGAFSVGSINTHRNAISRISRASGARALGINYRLAPENPFPAGLQDCVTAYRWLLSNGADPAKTAIAGDSAGGCLTLATLLSVRDAGEPLPAAAVCFSPWVDLETIGESMTTKANIDPFLDRNGLMVQAKMYIGDGDRRNPLAAPLYADLRGLPPLLIHVGSAEVLMDDSTRIAENARAAGVDVTLEVWDDMIHVWQLFAPILAEGQQSLEGAGKFIHKHIG